MPFGLNEKGFKRKRYADIRKSLESKWKEGFGENSRTDENSPNGVLISLIAYVASPLWMLAEKVYNNGFVHKASGDPLSNIVKNNLVSRRGAEKASGYIVVTGDEGTVVEKGFKASREISYSTTGQVTIGDSEQARIPVIADIAGAVGNAPKNSVVEIDTPIVGVSEVTNPEPISGGIDEETDEELKARYNLSRSSGGSPSANGIRAELLGSEGVRLATIVENLELEMNDGKITGRNFEPYVSGGSDEDIANAIFKRRAAGIEVIGETVVDVTSDSGQVVPIGFTRMEEEEIYIELEVKTNNLFPSDGNKRIVTSIIEYIGGMDEDGNVYVGLQTDKDVDFTTIIGLVYEVGGVDSVTSLKMGTDKEDLKSFESVEITSRRVATTDYEKIDVL